jgi:hypothetical protein
MMRRAISHVILSKGETTMRGFAKPSHGGFANPVRHKTSEPKFVDQKRRNAEPAHSTPRQVMMA